MRDPGATRPSIKAGRLNTVQLRLSWAPLCPSKARPAGPPGRNVSSASSVSSRMELRVAPGSSSPVSARLAEKLTMARSPCCRPRSATTCEERRRGGQRHIMRSVSPCGRANCWLRWGALVLPGCTADAGSPCCWPAPSRGLHTVLPHAGQLAAPGPCLP